jgi:hypothetical protein
MDLGAMKAAFFGAHPNADLSGDGFVNFVDLGLLKKGFFQPPGPSGKPNDCDAIPVARSGSMSLLASSGVGPDLHPWETEAQRD